jgi:hypothetical protein
MCTIHSHSFAAPAQIRVLPSQSKNRLYLGNLPKTISKDELDAQVRAATKGALVCMPCFWQHVTFRHPDAEWQTVHCGCLCQPVSLSCVPQGWKVSSC